MPTTRKRPNSSSVGSRIPDITEDAEERKRLLNVLAQRRYRKRRRERLAKLEEQVEREKDKNALGNKETLESSFPRSADVPSEPEDFPVDAATGTVAENVRGHQQPPCPKILGEGLFPEAFFSNDMMIGSEVLDDAAIDELFPPLPGLTSGPSAGSSDSELPPSPFSLGTNSMLQLPPDLSLASILLTSPYNSGVNYGTEEYLSSTLQDHQSSTFTFPDDHILEVPSLTLLRAVLLVATRLDVCQTLWDITKISPFYRGPTASSGDIVGPDLDPPAKIGAGGDGSPASDLSMIPAHLQPTPTQRLIPHPTFFDLFPWPGTRDKLIQIFSVPAHLRPPAAQDPLALVRLVSDMEDPEGLLVNGQDPFEPRTWEIGQVMFERWWWAFESGVVERSNRSRQEKGKSGLILEFRA